MGSLWIALGTDEEQARRCRALVQRAGGGRMLWIDDASAAEGLVECAAREGDEAHVLACDGAEGLDALVEAASRVPGADVVVLTETDDPARVMELFRIGAREVIAGKAPAAAGDASVEARVESVPARPHAAEAPRPAPAGASEPEPWRQPAMQRHVADLDEPDLEEVWRDEQREAPAPADPSPAPGQTGRIAPRDGAAPEAPRIERPPVRERARTAAGGGAPVVAAVSGCGGCGKSTVIAAMALTAAQGGLRTAVLDLDLMFGRLYIRLGAESAHDLGCLIEPASRGSLDEDAVVRASVRISPGLTLWGPLDRPEQAELMGPAVEQLLDVLRVESDIVFVDTSTFWGDAVAAAVAVCDRCLVVADARPGAASASARAIDLVGRLGVPRTRVVGVFNRCDGKDGAEDAETRFAFTVSLSARERIAEGGREVAEMAEIGKLASLCQGSGAFASSVRAATARLATELGRPLDLAAADSPSARGDFPRHRIHLPWKRMEG